MDRKISEQKLNVEFVKEVEKYPCIYDYRRWDYSKKEVIDKAWATIGEKINLSGPQCRERWKNLRTVLSRNLVGTCEKYGQKRSLKQQRKPYYLFDAMQFAVPFIKRCSMAPPLYCLPKESSNSASDHEMKVEDDVEDDIDPIKLEITMCNQSSSPSPQYSSPPLSPKVNSLNVKSLITPTPPPLESTSIARKRKMSTDTSDIEEEERMPESCKKKKIKNRNKIKPNLTKISKKRFLLSLLSDVYAMDDNQMRSFRMKVLNIINDIAITPSSAPSGEALCSACQSNNVNSSRPSAVADQSIEIVNETIVPHNVFYPSVALNIKKEN